MAALEGGMIAVGWILLGLAFCVVALLVSDARSAGERAAQDEIDPFEGGGPV